MPAVQQSIRPGSLSDVHVTLDPYGGDISAHLALALSDLGARVLIEDEHSVASRHVRLSICDEQCEASAPQGGPPGSPETAAALIRMFSKATAGQPAATSRPVRRSGLRAAIRVCKTANEAAHVLEDGAPADATGLILIVANEGRAERIMLEQLLALHDDRQIHAVLVPPPDEHGMAIGRFQTSPGIFDIGSMTALIALLLGPDGRGIPNQSFRFEGAGSVSQCR